MQVRKVWACCSHGCLSKCWSPHKAKVTLGKQTYLNLGKGFIKNFCKRSFIGGACWFECSHFIHELGTSSIQIIIFLPFLLQVHQFLWSNWRHILMRMPHPHPPPKGISNGVCIRVALISIMKLNFLWNSTLQVGLSKRFMFNVLVIFLDRTSWYWKL